MTSVTFIVGVVLHQVMQTTYAKPRRVGSFREWDEIYSQCAVNDEKCVFCYLKTKAHM